MSGDPILPPFCAGYRNKFEVGEAVTILDRRSLEFFRSTWKYHHNLTDEMINQAGRRVTVQKIGYYHGGDVLYVVEETVGTWHEHLFEEARNKPSPDWPPATRASGDGR